jgi:acetyltransferase-like isoleucine patch superfamily enzyme
MLTIVLEKDDANSESALLVEWLVPDGAIVRTGQPICVIETSKTAIELVAPGDGTIRRVAGEGDEVDLGGRIAVIAADPGELAGIEPDLSASDQTSQRSAALPNATRKAAELAATHGIDLSLIQKAGFITVEDVEQLIGRQIPLTSPAPGSARIAGVSVQNVSFPDSAALAESVGALEPEFFERLRADPDAVRDLPALERLETYRRHGARIGQDVTLGERTVIVSPRIVLDDGVVIGDDGVVNCEESFCVGPLTRFGNRLKFHCRRAAIGAGGYFCDDVQIGGGGAGDPQALLVIGDLAYVGDEAYINPCRPILIGREVFVTMRSVLVTHNVGHSIFEGFENRFDPIVLEDGVQIGIATVVYAGCRIGTQSIVGSNSYVVSDIPAGKLAIGVPATVAGRARRTVSAARKTELAERLFDELYESLSLRGHAVAKTGSGREFSVETGDLSSRVLLREEVRPDSALPLADGEVVVLTLAVVGNPPPGCSVLDLVGRRVYGSGGVVLDSVREHCRKRGVRFEPGPWRYRGGLVS